MVILLIILSVVVILLLFALYNILRKYERIEEDFDSMELYIESLYLDLKKAIERMKALDTIGSFESDDETGFIFNQIKDMILKLEITYLNERKEEQAEKEA